MAIPTDPNAWLTRKATAQALTEAGFPVSAATLATKATRGGGPPFRKWGPRVLHRWGESLAWAIEKLGPLVTSTSELDDTVLCRSQIASSAEDERRFARSGAAHEPHGRTGL